MNTHSHNLKSRSQQDLFELSTKSLRISLSISSTTKSARQQPTLKKNAEPRGTLVAEIEQAPILDIEIRTIMNSEELSKTVKQDLLFHSPDKLNRVNLEQQSRSSLLVMNDKEHQRHDECQLEKEAVVTDSILNDGLQENGDQKLSNGIDNSNEQIDSPITTVLDNDKTELTDIPHGTHETLTSIYLRDHLGLSEISMFDENSKLHVKDWLSAQRLGGLFKEWYYDNIDVIDSWTTFKELLIQQCVLRTAGVTVVTTQQSLNSETKKYSSFEFDHALEQQRTVTGNNQSHVTPSDEITSPLVSGQYLTRQHISSSHPTIKSKAMQQYSDPMLTKNLTPQQQQSSDNPVMETKINNNKTTSLDINKIAQNVCKFSDVQGFVDAWKWLSEVNNIFDGLQFNSIQKQQMVDKILSGSVLRWYRNNSERMKDWNMFTNEFVHRYVLQQPRDQRDKLMEKELLNSQSDIKLPAQKKQQQSSDDLGAFGIRPTFVSMNHSHPTNVGAGQHAVTIPPSQQVMINASNPLHDMKDFVKPFYGSSKENAKTWLDDVIHYFDVSQLSGDKDQQCRQYAPIFVKRT
ncbi:unnamed protein product, partial [Didymodactylos carnosus]